MVQAFNIAKAGGRDAGNIPGSLERQIKAFLDPQASWEELLRRFMNQFAKTDYSWRTPNRRFIADGLYLPSAHAEQLPPILFVVDASGSMPEKSLHAAAAELQAIVDRLHPDYVDMLVHDTEVVRVERFYPQDQIQADVEAGGGTRFAPVCQWIDAHYVENQYSVAVWFTDLGAWDWEDCIEPECPVLWIDYEGSRTTPRFGDDVIRMNQ